MLLKRFKKKKFKHKYLECQIELKSNSRFFFSICSPNRAWLHNTLIIHHYPLSYTWAPSSRRPLCGSTPHPRRKCSVLGTSPPSCGSETWVDSQRVGRVGRWMWRGCKNTKQTTKLKMGILFQGLSCRSVYWDWDHTCIQVRWKRKAKFIIMGPNIIICVLDSRSFFIHLL